MPSRSRFIKHLIEVIAYLFEPGMRWLEARWCRGKRACECSLIGAQDPTVIMALDKDKHR